MKHLSNPIVQDLVELPADKPGRATPQVDMLAKGIVTGVAVSVIIHAGRGIVGAMARNPLVTFGFGVAVGFFARKYRKEIITVSQRSAEETREFVSRQKAHLQDLLAEEPAATDITPKQLH